MFSPTYKVCSWFAKTVRFGKMKEFIAVKKNRNVSVFRHTCLNVKTAGIHVLK